MKDILEKAPFVTHSCCSLMLYSHISLMLLIFFSRDRNLYKLGLKGFYVKDADDSIGEFFIEKFLVNFGFLQPLL